MSYQVTKTILEQLGGGRFVAMTGANHFVGDDNTLKFRLPGGGGLCKDGINYVTIRFEPSDTYTVEFFRVRALKQTQIKRYCDVYNDQLRDVFERATGLATSMGAKAAKAYGGQLS